jgi:4-amino-4-deoxy-L-arabinose transferase-like glycosyltransferase
VTDTVPRSENGPNDREQGWGGVACAVVLAVTMFRILVLVSTPVPLIFDEAQYWTWAQELAFGYYSKPPVIAWAIAGTTALCGDGEACVRLSAPLFHSGTALVLFFIARDLYSARTGFWVAATYVLLPGVTLSAVIISTDVFLLFFWAAALLALHRAELSNDTRWWALFGAALGFGLLSKYAMLFFLLGLVTDGLWRLRRNALWRRGKFWSAVVLAGVIYAPNLWWNWANGFPSYRHTGDNMNLSGDLFNPLKALEFLGAQLGVFGPILFAAFAVLLVTRVIMPAGRAALDDRQRKLIAYSLPIVGLITFEAFLSRAHGNWAAVAYIAATVWVVGELIRLERTKLIKISAVIHIGAAAMLYNFDLIVRTLDVPLTPGLDPARRMRGWDLAGNWLADLQRDFPGTRLLFDDRKVMAEMLYYVRPHPFDAVMWNPRGQRNNHYELTTDMSSSAGENFLYVIRHDWPGRAGDSFASFRQVATFRSRAFTGDVLSLRAYVLEDFRGYGR